MRRTTLAILIGVMCLGWATGASAQTGFPECDVCDLCGADLYVKLKTGFSYDVQGVVLWECTYWGCDWQDVSADMSLPMSGGDIRDVTLGTTPTVIHRYIEFEYCKDSSCSTVDWVLDDLYNCDA